MSMIALLKIPKIFTHLKRLINLKDKRFGLVTSFDIMQIFRNSYNLLVTPIDIDEQWIVGVYEEDIGTIFSMKN